MGVLKQQKEMLSGLFYNDFKQIFCEKKKGRQTKSLSLSKFAALLMIKTSILPWCKEINQKFLTVLINYFWKLEP